jgi:peroxiredoxin
MPFAEASVKDPTSTATVWVVLALVLCGAAGVAQALNPGDSAPAFDIPWLQGQGPTSSSAIFSSSDATVLVIWNRGCPRCTQIALGVNALADSVASLGGQVVGILFGPDDPQALTDLLWDRGVAVPHLWDAAAGTAAAYDLGIRHLGVFVIDRSGTVRALFDDQIPDLSGPVLPAVRGLLARPAATAQATSPARKIAPAPAVSDLSLDGRMRLLSVEGAHTGDTGLNGETLENGPAFLYRWNVRASWKISPGIEFVPRLTVSNEGDEVLTEAEEQRSNRHGTASLNARSGRLSATLGAYPLRLSPLLLQRWDAEDAPPLGGASGCGCGGSGGGGELQQYSLEVLAPSYLFEGVSAAWTGRHARLRAFGAIPRWENSVLATAGPTETQRAVYRRTLTGATIEAGIPGPLDPRLDLPAPAGLRMGYLSVGDDQRTLPARGYYRPSSWDENGWFLLGRVEPVRGISADAEFVDWHKDRASVKRRALDARGYRAGLRVEEPVGRSILWASVGRLHSDRDFSPMYGALTYEANREGWRAWAGLRLLEAKGGSRDRLAVTLFYRGVREVEAITWEGGRVEESVVSASLAGRPYRDLLAELHAIDLTTDRPPGAVPDLTTRGVSLDLRWDGTASIEPVLRVDALRRDDNESDPRTIWQGSFSVRIVR